MDRDHELCTKASHRPLAVAVRGRIAVSCKAVETHVPRWALPAPRYSRSNPDKNPLDGPIALSGAPASYNPQAIIKSSSILYFSTG